MSVLYLFSLCGVGVAVFAALFESALAVTQQPLWAQAPGTRGAGPAVRAVATVERRTQPLPFVGTDPRRTTAPQETASRDSHHAA
jgi:hypothetical protein